MGGKREMARLAAALALVASAAGGQTPPKAPVGNPTRIAGSGGAPLSPDLHLAMGAPTRPMAASGREATALIKRPQSVISYSDRLRTATWAAWHLGPRSLPPNRKFLRQPFFTVDPLLPKGFAAIEHGEYGADGFDRGHLVPAADRSLTEEDNRTTFLTTNILPQAPNNNQLAWERFERHCRDLAYSGRELFIVAGPNGAGGEGLNGPRTTIGRSRIAVPAETWKVALSLPAGKVKPSDVAATNAKVFALVTPNDQRVGEDWRRYETTLAEVERRTGYRFFPNVPPDVLRAVSEASAPKQTPQGKSPGGGDKPKQAKPKQPLKGGIGR